MAEWIENPEVKLQTGIHGVLLVTAAAAAAIIWDIGCALYAAAICLAGSGISLWFTAKRYDRLSQLSREVDRVLYDLKHNPASRRILTSLYNHQDLHEMNLYPCAWSMTFNVSGNVLNAILNQRSQDMLAANNWNVVQYAVLVHMLAQVSGLVPGELVHVIADAHIYDRHVPIIEKMLAQTPSPAPVFRMDPSVTDFYAFTRDSFSLEDYIPAPFEDQIPHRYLRRPAL